MLDGPTLDQIERRGGTLEASCQEKALKLLQAGKERTRFERCNLQKELGMTCGGEVALYFEVHRRELDWNMAIFDRLPRSPKLEACTVGQFSDGIERIVPGADVLLMTMGHSSDLPILNALSERNNTPGEIAISVASQLLKHRHAARE